MRTFKNKTIGVALIFLLAYLVGAFVCWDFKFLNNISEWDDFERSAFVVCVVSLIGYGIIFTDMIFKRK